MAEGSAGPGVAARSLPCRAAPRRREEPGETALGAGAAAPADEGFCPGPAGASARSPGSARGARGRTGQSPLPPLVLSLPSEGSGRPRNPAGAERRRRQAGRGGTGCARDRRATSKRGQRPGREYRGAAAAMVRRGRTGTGPGPEPGGPEQEGAGAGNRWRPGARPELSRVRPSVAARAARGTA